MKETEGSAVISGVSHEHFEYSNSSNDTYLQVCKFKFGLIGFRICLGGNGKLCRICKNLQKPNTLERLLVTSTHYVQKRLHSRLIWMNQSVLKLFHAKAVSSPFSWSPRPTTFVFEL